MSAPERCEEMRPLVSALVDGELPVEDAAFVRAHLATCAECRALEEELRATSALVASVRASGWAVVEYSDNGDVLSGELSFSHPIIALIEDRPGRYHYVVVVGERDLADGVGQLKDMRTGEQRAVPVGELFDAVRAAVE